MSDERFENRRKLPPRVARRLPLALLLLLAAVLGAMVAGAASYGLRLMNL